MWQTRPQREKLPRAVIQSADRRERIHQIQRQDLHRLSSVPRKGHGPVKPLHSREWSNV